MNKKSRDTELTQYKNWHFPAVMNMIVRDSEGKKNVYRNRQMEKALQVINC